ncbi:MAG: 1-acyl-sn-glycerol-3-phosphate acyltransferase [Candidatus Comchoanobacterales bacterium]
MKILFSFIYRFIAGIVATFLIISCIILYPIVALMHYFIPIKLLNSQLKWIHWFYFKGWWIFLTDFCHINIHIEQSGAAIDMQHKKIFIANHQGFFDTILTKSILSSFKRCGEIQFVLKDTLKWLPFFGTFCFIRRYPFVKQLTLAQVKANPRLKHVNQQRIQKSVLQNKSLVTGWVIFPEGTRNDGKKKTPFQHVLRPNIKGMQLIKETVNEEIQVIDLTICYPKPYMSMWQLLTQAKKITVHMHLHEVGAYDLSKRTLQQTWVEKDDILSEHYAKS